MATPSPEPAVLRRWLIERVAARTGTPAGEIDDREPFSLYGLDSAGAAAIAGELQEMLGRPVDVTALFDSPCVSDLVRAVVSPRPAAASAAAGAEAPGVPEPVAIVGIACRVPGATGPDAFWRLLLEGRDALGEVPIDRWPEDESDSERASRLGGFLADVAGFDAAFFHLPREEAVRMDPQQRLLLETTWEALEAAGEVPERLRGTPTGVFVGISTNEYGRRQVSSSRQVHALTPTGNALSIAANRLSYFYDFRGPSLAVDTACSSSLVATHLALQSLGRGECARAVVGGVNLLLEPEISVGLARGGMLAPDGRCRAFAASAKGYVRGEGCVVVVLKPLSRARADGDHVHALLLGSAVNQDGRTNGLTAPSRGAQEEVLRLAYGRAGVNPGGVGYVECHGTGTPLGDPIEARALGAVVGRARPEGVPCLIGSVKTNVGHLEAAAGLAGLVKAALALEHGTVPPSLHFDEPNPNVPFGELGLEVATTARPWPTANGERLAGVSSFGFGGTNAHVVLSSAPEAPDASPVDGARPWLLPVSAEDAGALTAGAEAWARRLEGSDPSELPHLVHTAASRRTHHRLRLAAVGDGPAELAGRLREAARAGAAGRSRGRAADLAAAFVFGGQGAQWPGMARDLVQDEPVFTSTLRRCDEVLSELAGWTVTELLVDDAAAPKLERTEFAQPCLFAVQCGLAAIWRARGIEPAWVAGHSLGEIAAATVAGALTLEQGIRLAHLRGTAMAGAHGAGKMLAVGLTEQEAAELAARHPDRVAVAAVNGPAATVLAGDAGILERVRLDLEARERFARWLPVAYAFHSPQMEEAASRIASSLGSWFTPSPPDVPFFSTVTGDRVDDALRDPRYWARNAREPVRFAAAVDRLLDCGPDAVIEISPQPTLRAPLRELLRARGRDVPVVAAMRRDTGARRALLDALASLYTAGFDPDWQRVLPPGGRVVAAPGYQWAHEPFWFERPSPAPASACAGHPLLGCALDLAASGGRKVWEAELDEASPSFLADHRVAGAVVLPATAYVEMALAAARALLPAGGVELRQMRILAPLRLGGGPRKVQVVLEPDGDAHRVTIHSRGSGPGWTENARCAVAAATGEPARVSLTALQARCLEHLPRRLLYDSLRDLGLSYGPSFQGVLDVWRGEDESVGAVAGGEDVFECDPRTLDAAFHLLRAAGGERRAGLLVPVGFDRLRRWAAPVGRVYGAVRLRTEDGSIEADIQLLDADGTPLVDVTGLHLVSAAGPRAAAREDAAWLYETAWRPAELPAPTAVLPGTRHLLLASDGDGQALAEAVAFRLRQAGAEPVIAPAGAGLDGAGAGGGRSFDSVVCLLASGRTDDPGRAVRVTRAALEVVKALTSRGGAMLPALWMVTSGAQPVLDGEVADPFSAGAWGIAKVIPFENPALRCRCVDVEPAEPERAAGQLLGELGSPSDEGEIGYRAGTRYVRRLVPAVPLEPAPEASLALDPDGTYLLTGGLGGIGLQVARRLVERGARRLALLARGAHGPDAEAAVADLRAAGATVELLQADVTCFEALDRALDRARGGSGLRGIVHLAGVLDDRPLMATDEETLAAVVGPKAAGTWHLLELTAADPLDWVVCFSSAASVLGSPGQGAYCAANAVMDAVASQHRSRGRPICCLNWGPWADEGMAARAGHGSERRFGSAYTALHPADGLDILERALAAGRTGLLVLPFDLRNLLQFYPVGLGLPLYADLSAGEVARLRSIGQGSQPARRPDLGQAYTAPRTEVEERIASLWQASLGLDRVGVLDEFFELGGDSVFANQILVEVSRSLGVSVDAARAFENFTVAGLAALAEEAVLERLQDMTDEEAGRLAGGSDPGVAG